MITKKSFDFLSDLKANNNRDWFQENKKRYEASHAEMIDFADHLLQALNKDDLIETPNGKKSLYRIYRDVRFSANKAPYKSNRSGSFRRAGADRRGGYYFSISPGNTLIGGGFYSPSKEDLNLIRNQIQLDASPLRKVLDSKKFKNYFGSLQGEQLKTAPRGFDPQDPNIDLLRYKSFFVFRSFSDAEVLSDDFVKKASQCFQNLRPFFDVMTEYLTTDLNGESTL